MDTFKKLQFYSAVYRTTLSSSTIIQASLIALIGALLLVKLVQRLRVKLPPGPPGWPIVGNWFQFNKGLNPHNLAELAQKYGDVCMLQMGQKKVVVVSSTEMAREVLQTQGIEFGSRARNLVFDILTSKGQDMVFADYGEHWRKVRKICSLPFFANKVVQQSRYGWEEEIELTMSDLKQMPGASTSGIIIRDRLQLMMYNVVYRMMFSRRFSGFDDPLYVQLMALNLESNRFAQSLKNSYGDCFPSLKPFLRGYLQQVLAANQRRLVFLRDTFLEERKKQAGEKIGVDYILDAHAKGEINENSVLYLIQNMNVAAIETTLWSLEWGVAELVNNKHMQEKLRKEMDDVLGKGMPVTEPDLARLPYLQAFVKEILRFHMVIPMLVPHSNLHAAKLGKYDIPAGSKILVNAWAIANDPRYWDEPNEFNPDRFLNLKVQLNGNDMRFIPFGSGRRSCPGIWIALAVMGLVLGRLVQSFELLPSPGEDKVDLRAWGGQLNLSIAVKSRVVLKARDI